MRFSKFHPKSKIYLKYEAFFFPLTHLNNALRALEWTVQNQLLLLGTQK